MRFTLTIEPNGRALLSTPDELDPDEVKRLTHAWDEWKQTPQGLAIVTSCEIELVHSHEIDLEVSA